MAISTALTRKLGLQHPVLLAPMGAVSGGALAAAVSRAGGLGLIGGGYGDPIWLAEQFAAAGNEAVGAGFITWSLAKQPDLLDMALQRRPRAMLLSFGDLRPFAAKIKSQGVPLIAQVQTVAQAREAVAEGADIVVAQGTEAGGHGGTRATLPLVPAVVDALGDVPVVAAGGIADGRGLAAALMLGAAGVMCGTVFYATAEALAHPNAKRAVAEGSGDATERGTAVDIVRGYSWPPAWNIRTLTNSFTRQWRGQEETLRRNLAAEQARYMAARDAGDMTVAATIAGEAVDLVRGVETAEAVINRIVSEAESLLRRAPEAVTRD